MPKASIALTSFNAGELSPLLPGRIDFEKRLKGSNVLENFLPTRQGPITSRSGTRYVSSVFDSSKKTRLIPFEYSVTQNYMIECSEYVFRFYKDNGRITGTSVTGITSDNGSPVTFTKAGHGLNDNDLVYAAAGSFTEQTGVNDTTKVVVKIDDDTFQLHSIDGDLDNTAGDYNNSGAAETTGGTLTWQGIQHPYSEADLFDDELFDLQYAQSADVLYLAHRDHHPRELTRSGDTSWSLTKYGSNWGAQTTSSGVATGTEFVHTDDGPYRDLNFDVSKKFQIGGSNANTYVSIQSFGHSPFVATDVGRQIRLGDNSGTKWIYAIITEVTDADNAYIYLYTSHTKLSNIWEWQFGLWSDTTGYPATVSFFQNRLCWSGTPTAPQRVDFSASGLYETFSPTIATNGDITDDLAISVTVNSNQVNYIRWIRDDEKGLLAGSVGGEWLIRANTLGAAVSPLNIQATQSTTYGTENIPSLRAGSATLFIQRSGRKVRELSYSFDADGFKAVDMTLLAEHITESKIIGMAYQREPYSIVWLVRGDGKLIGFTYDRDESVVAFHKHIVGGTTSSGDAEVKGVACIPSVDKDRDDVWMVVEREVDSATVQYVEFMEKEWILDRTRDQEDAFNVDCGYTYDGVATTSITGLDHLEGEVVTVVVDGAAHPDKTVSGGAITLDREGSVVHVGYSYTPVYESMELEGGGGDGPGQSKIKRINYMKVRLHETLGGHIGPDTSNMTEFQYRVPSDLMGARVPLYDGYKIVDFKGEYERDAKVRFEQRQPFPVTIIAIFPQLVTQDRG